MSNVVNELRKTSKGQLVYHRKRTIEDIHKEIENFICVSVTPINKYDFEKQEKEIAIEPETKQISKKFKTEKPTDFNKNLDSDSIIKYAQIEHSIIQYELERKNTVKKQISKHARNWNNRLEEFQKKFETTVETAKEPENRCENVGFHFAIEKENNVPLNNQRIAEERKQAREEIKSESMLIEKEGNQNLIEKLNMTYDKLKPIVYEIVEKFQKINPVHQTQHIISLIRRLKDINTQMDSLVNNDHLISLDIETAISYLEEAKEILLFFNKLDKSNKDNSNYFSCKENIIHLTSSNNEVSNSTKIISSLTPVTTSSVPSIINTEFNELKSHSQIPVISVSSACTSSIPIVRKESPIPNNIQENVISELPSQYEISENMQLDEKKNTYSDVLSGVKSSEIETTEFLHEPNMIQITSASDVAISHSIKTILSIAAVTSVQTMTNNQIKELKLQSKISNISVPSTCSYSIPEISRERTVTSAFEINSVSNQSSEHEAIENMQLDENKRTASNISSKDEVVGQFIDPEALEEYTNLFEFLEKWKDSYQILITDNKWKKAKFDLQKAINTPINSTSDISATHLHDKMKRLEAFLSGQNVEVAGKIISINVCPEGRYFCMDLLAKKLVSQGESQISSRPEAAFPLAALTVYLCQKYPELQKLFLAHLYKKCPYLVPYYIPRKEGQSEEEHLRELGYMFSEGIVENQVMFLKRMSGIVRLYAALIQTPPLLDKPHPHGIRNAWIWLSRLLNLAPQSDITATILVDFLEVAGYLMQKTYGKQFQKLIQILAVEFLPKIKLVTSAGSGGPLQRLESFLAEYFKKGSISQPSGILNSKFWRGS